MNLSHARMVATFTEGATNYGPCTTLADSLQFAWTSVYTRMGDADVALEWLRNNVIGISPVTCIHEQSPTWKETANDIPHNRDEVQTKSICTRNRTRTGN